MYIKIYFNILLFQTSKVTFTALLIIFRVNLLEIACNECSDSKVVKALKEEKRLE